jgi:hypothetical protein
VHVALLIFSDKLRQFHVSVSLHTQKPTEKNNGNQLHKATDGKIWYFYSNTRPALLQIMARHLSMAWCVSSLLSIHFMLWGVMHDEREEKQMSNTHASRSRGVQFGVKITDIERGVEGRGEAYQCKTSSTLAQCRLWPSAGWPTVAPARRPTAAPTS